MLRRIAELALHRARALLLLTLVAVVAMGAVGFGAFGKLQPGGFEDPQAPSARAQTLIDEKFGGESNLVLLVRAKGGSLDTPDAGRAGRELTEGLAGEPHISRVTSYWDAGGSSPTSRDGTQALVLAHVEGDSTALAEHADEVTEEWSGDRGAVTVQAGGSAALNNDVSGQVSADLAVAEAIAVPVTLLLLVLAFGSLVAALLPLAIGLIAILGTFAELYVPGSLTDVSVFSVNLTTALGLGIGIDYGLLLVSRFRERLAEGDSTGDALRTTVRTAGRTIAFSAATVVAALAALLLFPQFFLRSFAYAGIGVVAIAALAALIVVPALLAVLGHRVNAGRLPWADAVRRPDAPLWGRLARTVMRRPALTALPVLAVLLLAASPLLGASFGTPDERVLPEDAESRQVSVAVQEDFGGSDADAVRIVTRQRRRRRPDRDHGPRPPRRPGPVRRDPLRAGGRRPGAGVLQHVHRRARHRAGASERAAGPGRRTTDHRAPRRGPRLRDSAGPRDRGAGHPPRHAAPRRWSAAPTPNSSTPAHRSVTGSRSPSAWSPSARSYCCSSSPAASSSRSARCCSTPSA